jgi:putative ABC transport system permease protein
VNLAVKDIAHNVGRFALTALGISMLLMAVMGMSGIYRGMIEDATLLTSRIGADLWLVQRTTRGPFAEQSHVPTNLVHRATAVPGVRSAREFVEHTIQRVHNEESLRMSMVGLNWPDDKGQWVPLIAGRPLSQNHFEMIADESLDLHLQERVRLGKEIYTVVGITSGMIDLGGDGIGFFTVSDAETIQCDNPNEAVHLERAARYARNEKSDEIQEDPTMLEQFDRAPTTGIPDVASPQVSAVIVQIAPGANLAAVQAAMSGWPDVSVYTKADQEKFLLEGAVDKARRQISLFSILLTIIAGIIMALILYTLTLEKLRSIALLKLIGASNWVILGMIVQQALALGALGYALAYGLGLKIFPMFPRRVILTKEDLIELGILIFIISVASSSLGIWKALHIAPNEALAG